MTDFKLDRVTLEHKIKLLSLVDLGAKSTIVSFEQITRPLDLTATQVDGLVIETVTHGLCQARIDEIYTRSSELIRGGTLFAIVSRRHRYIFRNKKKVSLQELGPRFTLKLFWVQKGTFDTKFGEYLWVYHRKSMGTNKRKFML